VAAVRDALDAAVDGLTAAGVEDARFDAELLLAEATGYERARLTAEPGAELPAGSSRAFGEVVRRRLRREPVAYILGRKGFRHIELAVDRRVLVPRPETELLVEVAVERGARRVLDVGTGSGAIALAVADELPECEVVATDTSSGALEVARANAARLGLAERVRFVEGTLPDDGEFDLILANLPYIPDGDWPTLQPEVRDWEPREALLAGPDGLDAYRSLLSPGDRHLSADARQMAITSPVLAAEVGVGQAQAVGELMRAAGFEAIEVRCDLAGIERVVIGLFDVPGHVQEDER
jgi:release factor glutamine methyltransferase